MSDKWAVRWFELAQHAARWSKDPVTKVGAVLVSGYDIREMALGYNGPPRKIRDLPERLEDRKTKYLFVQHAERNVLDNAKFSCVDATLATTMFPCVECTKSLISKGVARLITPRMPEPLPNGEKSWRDDCATSLLMLREAGVRLTWIDWCGQKEWIPTEEEPARSAGNSRG